MTEVLPLFVYAKDCQREIRMSDRDLGVSLVYQVNHHFHHYVLLLSRSLRLISYFKKGSFMKKV